MRTLLLLVLLAPCAFGQSRGWFLMPLVNGNIQVDSLTYETGDTLNPVAGGFSIAHLNWKDSTALVLVHTSPDRITSLAKQFSYLGGDSVAVKDSVVVDKEGKATPLITSGTVTELPKTKGVVTATSLQQVVNAYKIPATELLKVSIGVPIVVKPTTKPIDTTPIKVTK